MSLFLTLVTFTRPRRMNNLQFKYFLSDMELEYGVFSAINKLTGQVGSHKLHDFWEWRWNLLLYFIIKTECGLVFCRDTNQHMKELLQGVHHLVSHILSKEQQLTGSFDCENYIQPWSNNMTRIQPLSMKTQQTQMQKERWRRKRDCSKDENKIVLLQKFLNTNTIPLPSRTYGNLLLN